MVTLYLNNTNAIFPPKIHSFNSDNSIKPSFTNSMPLFLSMTGPSGGRDFPTYCSCWRPDRKRGTVHWASWIAPPRVRLPRHTEHSFVCHECSPPVPCPHPPMSAVVCPARPALISAKGRSINEEWIIAYPPTMNFRGGLKIITVVYFIRKHKKLLPRWSTKAMKLFWSSCPDMDIAANTAKRNIIGCIFQSCKTANKWQGQSSELLKFRVAESHTCPLFLNKPACWTGLNLKPLSWGIR